MSRLDLTSNVSYFCGPLWDKRGGGGATAFQLICIISTSQTKLPGRKKTPRNSQRNTEQKKKAQSSTCTGRGLPPVLKSPQQCSPGRRERVPKPGLICVIYPVTLLCSFRPPPPPLPPVSSSFLASPFGRRGWSGRTSDRSGAARRSLAADVSGRVAPCPTTRCSLSRARACPLSRDFLIFFF